MTGLLDKATRSARYRSLRLLRQANQVGQRALHRARLPEMDPTEAKIVDGLRTEGAYTSSIDELESMGIPDTRELFETLKSIVAPMRNESCEGEDGYVVHAPERAIMENSGILKWGLSERLLAIMENYFGLPAVFPGVAIRRDVANRTQLHTRYWHLDSEDTRIVKIIVYIEDVGTNDGPFCYIPSRATKNHRFEVFDGSRVSDSEMTRQVTENLQIECTGPAGTVLFADPCSVWHRGKTGTERDRYTAFFLYSSRIPLRPETVAPMFPVADLIERYPDLTPLQRHAISYF